MMLKLIIFCFGIVYIPQLNAQNSSFEVYGNLNDIKDGLVAYLVLNEKNDTIETSIIKEGKFNFKGTLNESIAWASVRISNVLDWPVFFLEKNKKIEIEGSVNNWINAIIRGSKETDLLICFKKKLRNLEHDYKQLNELATLDTLNYLSIKAAAQKKLDSAYIVKMNLIHENPDSGYVAWLIYKTKELSLEQKDVEFQKLNESAKESEFGRSLGNYLKSQRKSNKLVKYSTIPNLKIELIEGDETLLREMIQKNKLTLLDFWASWCWPCREMTPELKKIYDSYHNEGFGIISLSLDKNEKAWREAVSKDNMVWINARASKSEGDPTDIFDIHALPSMILIDKECRIIAIKNGLSKAGAFGFDPGNEIHSLKEILQQVLIKGK